MTHRKYSINTHWLHKWITLVDINAWEILFILEGRLGDGPRSAQVYHLCSPLTYCCQNLLIFWGEKHMRMNRHTLLLIRWMAHVSFSIYSKEFPKKSPSKNSKDISLLDAILSGISKHHYKAYNNIYNYIMWYIKYIIFISKHHRSEISSHLCIYMS